MTPAKIKVFELAKELGIDSMTLLEKLKTLDIDVKSHMSALGTEEVRIAKEHISKEQALLSKATKTTKKSEGQTQKRVTATVIRRRTVTTLESQSQEAAPSTPQVAAEASPPLHPTEELTQKTETAAHSTTSALAETTPTSPQPTSTPFTIPSLLGAKSSGKIVQKTGSVIHVVPETPLPKPAPQVRPKIAGQPPVPRTETGIINLGKEAIDRLVEEEQIFKKKSGVGKGEREKEPLDVKVADYRAKKELVFLPKKKKIPPNKEIKQTQITTPAAHKRVIKIENGILLSELASRIGIRASELIKKLMGMGVMATANQNLDLDTATLLATEYKYEIENVAFKEESLLSTVEDKPESLISRPPIVTVMGHVDHGKTSLLDAIRSTDVASGEAGGITQHIGAYTVDLEGKRITFIDTPGHEAFTVMRARGAHVTDIVVLVVAADDGVMPQTREAVDHAKAANVPIIVAINKIDKPNANPDKVMKGLSELGLISEAWGGENIFVQVSATKRTGIKELLESILLQAEVLDLKANPNRPAEGTVLEAKLHKSRGPIVTILVKKGSLKMGDILIAGTSFGRVRALNSAKGQSLKSVGPSEAAELLGLEEVPVAGDTFYVMPSEATAREVISHRIQKKQEVGSEKTAKMTLEELFSKVEQGDVKELAIVLKTDVVGSTEAIKDSLAKLETPKVKVKVLHASTGGVTESDVLLASASNAIVIGFNVRPETKALQLAEKEKIEIKTYSIIYELLDEIKKAMAGLLEKKAVEKYLGRAEVRELFQVPKVGTIAGSAVVDGKILRQCNVRVLRDNRVIYTGKLSSLKRFKDDAKEVAQGYECGMSIENYNDLKQGDIIEAFAIEMIAQELDTPELVATQKPPKEVTQHAQ